LGAGEDGVLGFRFRLGEGDQVCAHGWLLIPGYGRGARVRGMG
jgi:hypothetical protein